MRINRLERMRRKKKRKGHLHIDDTHTSTAILIPQHPVLSRIYQMGSKVVVSKYVALLGHVPALEIAPESLTSDPLRETPVSAKWHGKQKIILSNCTIN